MILKKLLASAPLAAPAMLLYAAPAFAQVDEIIVSAEKRDESQQDIPVAVTALDSDALRNASIDSSYELAFKTPSLVLSTNASNGQPYIRGIGTDIINPGTESSVAVNFSNVYLPRPDGSITEFFDLDRIEVLRGPQGTLYGRNATGGAINIIPNRPGDEYEAAASVIYGKYDRVRAEAAVNVPIADAIAVRASAVFARRDGYVDNLTLNRTEDDEDLWGGRFQARFDDGGPFTLLAGVEWVREDSTRGAVNITEFDPAIPAFALGALPTGDPFQTRANVPAEADRDHLIGFIDGSYEFAGVTLRSITGYVKTIGENFLDLDGTEIEFARDVERTDSKSISQELQLLSDDAAKLRWVAGLYFMHEDAQQFFPVDVLGGAANQTYQSANDVSAYAAFGQATYALTDRIELTLGGRYSYEKKSGFFSQSVTDLVGGILLPAPGAISVSASPEESWDAFTPRVSIEFSLSDDAMIFASYSKGFKSGGFNLNGAGEIFDPENLSSVEAGLRAEWLDRRLRTNLTGFYYDYSDLQVNFFDGVVTVVDNAASAEVFGLEGEFVAAPNDHINVDLGFTWLDAEYDDYFFDNVIDLGGNSLSRAPEFTAVGGLELRTPVSGSADLALRGDFRYQSEVFFDQFNDPAVSQGGYALISARATLAFFDGRAALSVFGENLGNEVYRQNVIPVPGFLGNLNFFGAPRTFGVELRARY